MSTEKSARHGGQRRVGHVYWVGHSLMNTAAEGIAGFRTVMEGVKTLATAAGSDTSYFDHTMFGAPLSLNWRGRVHSYRRSEPEMIKRRRELDEHPGRYETLIMTEALPLRWQVRKEHSAFYARKFACALREANPNARVYLYESWPHLHASDPEGDYPPLADWSFVSEVRKLRSLWDSIAEQAASGEVSTPGFLGGLSARLRGESSSCDSRAPIHIIPVASALARLHLELEQLDESGPLHPTGELLTMGDLFANPLATSPPEWPGGEAPADGERARVFESMPRRHPDQPLDDIHPSALGIYFASLVSYATLSGEDPSGLGSLDEVPDEITELLQRVAWEVVSIDPKTGISSAPGDDSRPTSKESR